MNDRAVGYAQPAEYVWNLLNPYIKSANLWSCPGDTGYTLRGGRIDFRPNTFGKVGSSYVYHTDLAYNYTIGAWQPMSLSSLKNPSGGTYVSMDAVGWWHRGVYGPARSAERNTNWYNILYPDGHVKPLHIHRVYELVAVPRDQW
jgi:prepilin-type processing-associated H-X9-DG protein